jgi:hypothetical protein
MAQRAHSQSTIATNRITARIARPVSA